MSAKYGHLVGRLVSYQHPAGVVKGKVVKAHGSTLHVQVQTVEGYPAATVKFNYRAERQRWVQVGRAIGPVLVFKEQP